MDSATNRDIVDILILHEETIAGLYSTIADALPDMKDFWSILYKAEYAHAEVLRMLAKRLEQNGIILQPRKFNISAVQTSINYLRKNTSTIISEGTTPIRALSLALDLELSGLEQEFYKVFESDSAEMSKDFDELRIHEEGHRRLIKERLEKEKKIDAANQ